MDFREYKHLYVEFPGDHFFIRCYGYDTQKIEMIQSLISTRGGHSKLVEGKIDNSNICKDVGDVFMK